MSFYKFYVDNEYFFISENTLKYNNQSIPSQVIFNKAHSDRILLEDKNIIVDADKDSFRYIISALRGYKIDWNKLTDELKSKIMMDAEYFNVSLLSNDSKNSDKNINSMTSISYISNKSNKSNRSNTEQNIDDDTLDNSSKNDDDSVLNLSYSDFTDYPSDYLMETNIEASGGKYNNTNNSSSKDDSIIEIATISDDNYDTISSKLSSKDNDLVSQDSIDDIIGINKDEKIEFEENLENKKKILDKIENEEQMFNTNVLFSNDKTEVEKLICNIQDKLNSSDVLNAMNAISTDKNVIDFLKMFTCKKNVADTDSSTDSGSDKIVTENINKSDLTKTINISELLTDIDHNIDNYSDQLTKSLKTVRPNPSPFSDISKIRTNYIPLKK